MRTAEMSFLRAVAGYKCRIINVTKTLEKVWEWQIAIQ